MRPRTILNSAKEGFLGIFRHPLVMIASVTTILLMLLIISLFTIFSANARAIMDTVKKEPPIEVSLAVGITPEMAAPIIEFIIDNTGTTEEPKLIYRHVMETPDQIFENYKSALGEQSRVLDGFDETYSQFIPYKIRLQLVDPAKADEIVMQLESFQGVAKIQREEGVMNILDKLTRVVNLASAVAFIVLLMVSVFVISNMVRMSVYARAEEISIMKYVGATSFYIRLPYVMEGVITGVISAVCAWGFTHILYNEVVDYFSASQPLLGDIFTLLPVSALSGIILLVCMLTGVLIGAFGSGVSVRKYVQV